MILDGVLCSRPGSWGSRTGRHIIRDDGSREYCPTCDHQPLALAIVARRPWWRRLLDALPWRRRALASDRERSDQLLADEFARLAGDVRLSTAPFGSELARDEMRREVAYHHALIAWRARNDGRPAPTRIPSDGMPCSR